MRWSECCIIYLVLYGIIQYYTTHPAKIPIIQTHRPNTKPLRDHGIPNTHNHWSILFNHVWGRAWIDVHWNSIWLRARSHLASRSTRGYVTTTHDFGGVSDGLWTLSLGSQKFTVTGSWLVYAVALNDMAHPFWCHTKSYVQCIVLSVWHGWNLVRRRHVDVELNLGNLKN